MGSPNTSAGKTSRSSAVQSAPPYGKVTMPSSHQKTLSFRFFLICRASDHHQRPCLSLIEGFRHRAAECTPEGRPIVPGGGVKRRREDPSGSSGNGGMPPPITRCYCPTCGARYRSSFGTLLEVILHGVTYYWTATLPDMPVGEPYGMLGAFFHAALPTPASPRRIGL